ncbi:hypothetical protein [Haladaptatus sp. DYF46]|uniref:hypothetical protein n=1 Tax=Haladaptatus sp. DYF46 TaxID=2886041 RepID=UPI001E45CD59|nr:hypothetical protein [Haladaptatus sp. DYF46]
MVCGLVAVTEIQYAPTGVTAGSNVVLHPPSYSRLTDWGKSLYQGSFHPILVSGAIVLLLGATVSSYLNSGLFPTAGLVMGPIFGLFVNRVGNPVLVVTPHKPGLHFGPMPLSDAIVWGMESALILGLPILLIGFSVGSIFRWIISPEWILKQISSKYIG